MSAMFFSRTATRAYVHDPWTTDGPEDFIPAMECREQVRKFTGQKTVIGKRVVVNFGEDSPYIASVWVGRKIVFGKDDGRKAY